MTVFEFGIGILVIVLTFCLMELVAWSTHKHVMHGFLWVLHEDHHRYTGRVLEKNDLFAVFFCLLAIVSIYFGVMYGISTLTAFGIGVTLYGFGYFTVHDVLFHRRIKAIRFRPQKGYLRRVLYAHSQHHQHSTPTSGVSFGFLYAGPRWEVPAA